MKDIFIRTMAVSTAICILLLFIRIRWSGNITYIFLAWNLVLAWIPLILSTALVNSAHEKKARSKLFLIFLSWLIFFPNSPYIITDLFHLRQKIGVPLWFDLVLILFFAWTGLFLGFASLFKIRQFLLMYFRPQLVNVFVYFLLILCSFGVYLGRFPRWNSWDVVCDPLALLGNIVQMFLHPADNTRMIGVTFFFSLFLFVAYFTIITLAGNFKSENYGKEKV